MIIIQASVYGFFLNEKPITFNSLSYNTKKKTHCAKKSENILFLNFTIHLINYTRKKTNCPTTVYIYSNI